MQREKVTIAALQAKKLKKEPITALGAYDCFTASLLDEAGIDIIFVGDTVGVNVIGYPDTRPVTMDEMLHHARGVGRGRRSAYLVGDMPFLSYQVNVEAAVLNAGRFVKEAGMDAVKMEGGAEIAPAVRAVVTAGIPVMAHVFYPPARFSTKPQDSLESELDRALRFMEDIRALEGAGCFAAIMASIPSEVAKLVTERFSIITLGFGAGPYCDGQSLNTWEMLGLIGKPPRPFSKLYVNLGEQMQQAFQAFKAEVNTHAFPTSVHCASIDESTVQALTDRLGPALSTPKR
jgi:3-methyl-2-oxobutanoate hydroxymethyltransferase